MKQLLLSILFIITHLAVFAQYSQNVRGKIADSETNYPVSYAKIWVSTSDTTQRFQAESDDNGEFMIYSVPIGKHQLRAEAAGYDGVVVTIEVNSGKESIVNLAMIESFTLDEFVVISKKKGETINELALISSQQFSVEETNRYPGSRSDPARMASNFAGVQGADDSRNDIIIRGNSPLGVVWKIEGIDIPNPSHFATSGSTGGPVTIINNKLLANSDFFMSAFPAEYGNSTSGVFDLKLRNGNVNQHEFTGQFGFLGTEFMAEGPLKKGSRNSYLLMGRYSTLSMFKAIGIQIGTDAVPTYGDFGFKFNWYLKNGGNLSWFGLGGASTINIKISDLTELTNEVYGEGDRDQKFGTAMATTGLSYKKNLGEKTFLTSTLAASYDRQSSTHDKLIRSLEKQVDDSGAEKYIIRVDSIYKLMGYTFKTYRGLGHLAINHKFNTRHLIKAGVNVEIQYMDMLDTALNETKTAFVKRWDYRGSAALIQPFVQWKYRIRENMDLTAGLHAQYYSYSNSVSYAEPRAAWRWRMSGNNTLSAGVGIHSQTQPLYQYTYHRYDANGQKNYHNKNMDFSKSFHSAIGYEKRLKKNLQIKTEVYYQYLYQVPVTNYSSSFSMINQGSGFQRFFADTLVNEGTGYNYGLELTVQKYFDKSFFLLFTGSVYESKYRGSDDILRSTSYNGNYVFNLLAGKEFQISANQMFSAGFKVTYAGGKRYGYVDLARSAAFDEVIYSDSLFNERRFKNYFRVDLKVTYKINTSKVTHEIGLDLVNIFNTKNILGLAYSPNLMDPSAEPLAERLQLGFLPIFYYKIDFQGKKNLLD